MKYFFALLLPIFFVANAFCQTTADIQQLVLEAETEWNSGKPDKGFLSVGNSLEYGLGYLKKNKYTESLWYFDEVIKKEGNNAFANLFAGLANLGLRQFSVADLNFSRLAGISTSLQDKAKALLTKTKQEGATKDKTKTPEVTKPPVNTQGNPATKPTPNTTNEKPPAAENKKGGSLVYGDYVFTLDYWDVSQRRMVHQQKGYFTLNANGNYSYMGTMGKYNYNASTGVISWQSGTFKNMGKNTTTFQRNKTTCQVDFEYEIGGGKVYYSGGKNL